MVDQNDQIDYQMIQIIHSQRVADRLDYRYIGWIFRYSRLDRQIRFQLDRFLNIDIQTKQIKFWVWYCRLQIDRFYIDRLQILDILDRQILDSRFQIEDIDQIRRPRPAARGMAPGKRMLPFLTATANTNTTTTTANNNNNNNNTKRKKNKHKNATKRCVVRWLQAAV